MYEISVVHRAEAFPKARSPKESAEFEELYAVQICKVKIRGMSNSHSRQKIDRGLPMSRRQREQTVVSRPRCKCRSNLTEARQ